MEQKKRLTLLWRKLSFLEFGKDVVLVPYYLGKALDYQIEICCGYTDEVDAKITENPIENLKFIRRKLGYNPYLRIPVYIKYLLQNASHIDLLMCFHWRLETWINIYIYSILNKSGRIYIKLDTETGKEWNISNYSFLSRILRKWLYTKLLQKVNVLSCETAQAYDNIINNKYFGEQLKEKLKLMPNAFDEEYLNQLKMTEYLYSQKENIMITVGRLGTAQKNTEMLLKALENTDLKTWKFYLIGPIEDHFKDKLDLFFKQHPEKRESVRFLGAIYNKTELWDYYNRAKVFVCTSRWESYGIVLNEAKRFRNFIVSTSVGGAEDLIENGRYGYFVKQEDHEGLSEFLSEIVNAEINIDVYKDFDTQQLSYKRRVDIICKPLICN